MAEITVTKTVYCLEDGSRHDVGFCRNCDYFHGKSFDTIDCRYGEQIEDKIVEQIPKLNFRKLDTEDYIWLVTDRGHLLLKLDKKEIKSKFDLPEAEIDEEKFKDVFDVDFEELQQAQLTNYAYDGLRMVLLGGEIQTISSEFNWLWGLDADFELYAEDVYSPLYLIQDGEIFGAISPIRPSEDNFSKLREIKERVICND